MLAALWLILHILCLSRIGKLCVAIPVADNEQVTAGEHDFGSFGSNAPRPFVGRGLVLCAGGDDLLVRAIALVSTIRFHLRSKVPIQLFYAGAGEISPRIRQYFHQTLQVTTVFWP